MIDVENESLFMDLFELILWGWPSLTLLVAFVVTVWVNPDVALDALLLDISALGEFLLLMVLSLIPTALFMIPGMFLFACAGYGLAAVFVLLKWAGRLLMRGYSWVSRIA
ncbi:MAG: hypothetical protein SVC26_05170 [Pseudomonadota bacterium]|nr:hypothetical protein [Pseudomonadota bacterium]